MERLSKHLANPHSDVGGAKRAKVTVKKEDKDQVQTDRVEMGVEEGFVPMTPEKQKKIDRQIRRSADAEAIESGKRDRDRDDKKVDKEYRRQQAMRFQQKMKKEDLDLFSEAELESLMATEGALNPFQVHFDKDGKEYTSKGTKEQAKKLAKNAAENRKKGPMKYDPENDTKGT